MYRGHSVSVVVPCYNEEEGIQATMVDMPGLVDEVIVVDNNCTDRTAAVAQTLGAKVVPEPKAGYGAALKAGFRSATKDIIVAMDGDATYPRNFIPVVLDVMIDENLDFVTCDRTGHKAEQSDSFLRVLGNLVLNVVVLILYGFWLNDSQSGMWVFRRSILDQLNLTSDTMALSQELKIEAFTRKNLRSRELPIYYKARVGESKLNLWHDGFSNLLFLFRKRLDMLKGPRPRTGG
ncbi:MAG TPA: glycosyltransferase family 2 protein [Anaerolineae bacterium]|nr:glycosyltransferase family 2 protein [Anaerolineae bacterium]HNT05128.1 glycosyltransferase family 2 protein [Anaerolineae bacterium]